MTTLEKIRYIQKELNEKIRTLPFMSGERRMLIMRRRDLERTLEKICTIFLDIVRHAEKQTSLFD